MKIRAYTGYKPGRHLYNDFEIINELPKVGEESPFSFSEIVTSIKSVDLDCEQGDPEVWDYDYYRMESVLKPTELDEDDDPEDYKRVKYICIEKEDVDEEDDRFIDHLLDKGLKIYEKNQEFDKDNLLNYIVQLTCELTSYERLMFDVEHKNKKIGVYSEKEYDRTYEREYVFVSWTEDGQQTYYEFDVIK